MGMKACYHHNFHYLCSFIIDIQGSWNPMSIIPLILSFLLLLFIYNFDDVLAAPTRNLCRPEHRDALLEFKNEIEIVPPNPVYLYTDSWANNSDCCDWEGITCNAKSGEVIELDLSYNRVHGSISGLEKLHFLTTLKLANNDFYGPFPSSFQKLSHLTSLDLSFNKLSGEIASSIGNLSQLTSLDLSYNHFLGEIPSSIGNLDKLTSLDISNNNFTGEIPSSFGNLNQLTTFSVASNNLTGTLPSNFTSLSNLYSFDASHNALTGAILSSLFTIPSLHTIHLQNNQFNGTLEFGNTSSPSNLQELYLGNNNLRGPIPSSISRLTYLVELDLSHLNTTTTIELNDILPHLTSLSLLDLSGTHVSATNKSSVSYPPSLPMEKLFLSGCGITHFPEMIRTLEYMWVLDISNNKIKGQVPAWLWTIPNIYYVNLSNNTLTGFENPTKPGLYSVTYLLASNNNFTGKIPSFICALHYLDTLDFSNNNFNGSIPRCMGNPWLSVLNLGHNRLGGGFPENIFKRLRSLDVGHNQLLGKLPRSLIHFSTLEVLNVESNIINDTFPIWLSSLPELKVLVLRSNAFHGPIHQASFPKLKIIDISHNHFNGTLPSNYFAKWSAMSSLGTNADQSDEKYMGDVFGYYNDSMVLMNKGVEMKLVRILKIYTALDFSGNKFQGEIPSSIGLLKGLHVLNLSNNAFTGHIPSSMGNLTALESLDVSQNKLSGAIPQELGSLSFLAYMNFSHNYLAGLVPGGTQFRTQNCSSFEDNLGLVGLSLVEDCIDIHTDETQESEEEDDEEVVSWIAAAIGFTPGIVLGLTIGYILSCYRPHWFMNPFGRRNRSIRTYLRGFFEPA